MERRRRALSVLRVALVLAAVLLVLCNAKSGAAAADAGGANGGSTPMVESEKYEFKAEVNRLMDIIVHSLYSNREVFLRELISNAADALDKARVLALTDETMLKGKEELEIRIRVNKEDRVIEIVDTGVGMTHDELASNLGSIAKSGTSAFLEQLQQSEGDASNLIGQFGVGFYSAFLVADLVTVTSKSNRDDKQWIWQSDAHDSFTIKEDTAEDELGRGTKIALALKADASDFLSTDAIERLVSKYSKFISFPIYLEVQASASLEDDTDEEKDAPEDDGDEVAQDDDALKIQEADGKPESAKEIAYEWKRLNDVRPIWMREASEISEGEYAAFYEATTGIKEPPLAKTHFKAEGGVNFRALLYIPAQKQQSFAEVDEMEKTGIKLFVRRVLLKDAFEGGLLPRYLNFVLGVVDSDDLPINVSREMLQASSVLDMIKRKLLRKTLELIRSLMMSERSANEEREDASQEKAQDEDSDEVADHDSQQLDSALSGKGGVYTDFWKAHGKMIKFGVLEDDANRERLAKLLRFKSSKCNTSNPDSLMSLDGYVARMKEKQEYIYYHSGESLEQVQQSPFLETLLELDYEVIYLTEVLDEHVMQYLADYAGLKFMAASKDNFKFAEDDHKMLKKRMKHAKVAFKPLKKFISDIMPEKVSKVKLSARMTKSPCVLSTVQYGYSAHMELVTRAQAFHDADAMRVMVPKEKIMEINPFHPLTLKLLDLVLEDPTSSAAKALAEHLYDAALVSSGYFVSSPKEVAERMTGLVADTMGVDYSQLASAEDIETRVPLKAPASDDMGADESASNMGFEPDIDLDSMDLKGGDAFAASKDEL